MIAHLVVNAFAGNSKSGLDWDQGNLASSKSVYAILKALLKFCHFKPRFAEVELILIIVTGVRNVVTVKWLTRRTILSSNVLNVKISRSSEKFSDVRRCLSLKCCRSKNYLFILSLVRNWKPIKGGQHKIWDLGIVNSFCHKMSSSILNRL